MLKKFALTLVAIATLAGCGMSQAGTAGIDPSGSGLAAASSAKSELNQKLAMAVINGEAKQAIELLRAGANPNYQPKTGLFSKEDPIFFEAVRKSSVITAAYTTTEMTEVVKEFIKAKVNVNMRTQSKATPLMWAAGGTNLEAVKLLVAAKADLKAVDNHGRNAFDYTTYSHPEVRGEAGKKAIYQYLAALYN